MSSEKQKAIHFNDMLHVLEQAHKYHQQVDVKAWKSTGEKVWYRHWLVMSEYWRGGHIKLKNPRSGAVRCVPQIFIFEINKHKVYL